MFFQQKFPIVKKYLRPGTKRRSGLMINPAVKFIVAHDTGNPDSMARNNVDYYERTNNEMEASAHIFVDDREIIECIPSITTDHPEKAWHVRYNVGKDNELYGCEANDTAIGVEYCFGQRMNAEEAYRRYVWVIAYLCFKFNLNPEKSVIGHFILDPGRKTDPENGLKISGKSYQKLLADVAQEYQNCLILDKLEAVKKRQKSVKKKSTRTPKQTKK